MRGGGRFHIGEQCVRETGAGILYIRGRDKGIGGEDFAAARILRDRGEEGCVAFEILGCTGDLPGCVAEDGCVRASVAVAGSGNDVAHPDIGSQAAGGPGRDDDLGAVAGQRPAECARGGDQANAGAQAENRTEVRGDVHAGCAAQLGGEDGLEGFGGGRGGGAERFGA